MRVYHFDLEADGLMHEATKIHVIVAKCGSQRKIITENFRDEVLNLIDKMPEGSIISWHNMFGFDLPLIEKLLGIPFGVNSWNGKRFIMFDTLAVSRELWPDRPNGHGLEAWGEKLGIKKPEIGDWKNLSLEEYIHRCKEDVDIQEAVYNELLNEAKIGCASKSPLHIKIALNTYYLMCKQERTGVCFDIELAKQTLEKIDKRMAEIEAEVEPQLPKKKLNKGEQKVWTPPKIQFKKDGTPSANALKFFDKVEKVDGKWVGTKDGVSVELPCHKPMVDELPMRIKDQEAMKNWLMSLGWKPTFYNVKRDSTGRPVRENGGIVQTSPKFQDKGQLCPNLERLGNKVEIVKLVVEWLSLRNRKGVIEGWLSHDRLSIDGRLPPATGGIANTKRQKHRIVANIPRVSSTLGKEMRSLFKASEGKVFVGYDASGLEARVEAHYTYKYDGGLYAKELLDGDIHTKNAIAFFGDEVELDEDGKAKPQWRNPAKNGKYALTYGSQPPTLAATLHIPLKKAEEAFNNFWETNFALKQLKEAVEKYWESTGKKYIITIDRGKVFTRAKHSLVNALFQSTGARIMDVAGILMEKYLQEEGIDAVRVIYYHDEYIYECSPEDAERVAELGIKSIVDAGKFFKLRVPLDADAKIGKNWAEVH
jgi:hypothetical protein